MNDTHAWIVTLKDDGATFRIEAFALNVTATHFVWYDRGVVRAIRAELVDEVTRVA